MAADNLGLERFIIAQEYDYEKALAEIKRGRKQSHWMWYIFPQIEGLGMTDMSKRYAIRDIDEARAYLMHPVLGRRLTSISEALLELKVNDPYQIFGTPDDIKLRSCLTLFNAVPGAAPVFKQALAKFYGGRQDERTLAILAADN